MSYAIRIHRHGGPEVLVWEEVAVGDPGPGEVRLRQTAVGLNFIDVYHRTGLYPVPALPAVIGMEGAAVVEVVGAGVTDSAPGERVAYAGPPLGAYAQTRLMPADRLFALPDGDRRSYRGGDDAAGDDRRIPACGEPTGCRRAIRAHPRGGRRRRPHRLPVGEGTSAPPSSAPSAPTRRRRSPAPTAAIT